MLTFSAKQRMLRFDGLSLNSSHSKIVIQIKYQGQGYNLGSYSLADDRVPAIIYALSYYLLKNQQVNNNVFGIVCSIQNVEGVNDFYIGKIGPLPSAIVAFCSRVIKTNILQNSLEAGLKLNISDELRILQTTGELSKLSKLIDTCCPQIKALQYNFVNIKRAVVEPAKNLLARAAGDQASLLSIASNHEGIDATLKTDRSNAGIDHQAITSVYDVNFLDDVAFECIDLANFDISRLESALWPDDDEAMGCKRIRTLNLS